MSVRGWLLGAGSVLIVGGVALGLLLRDDLPLLAPGPCETHRELRYPPDFDIVEESRTIHHYDDQGRPVLDQRLLGGTVRETTRWEHDERGNVLLEEHRTEGPIFHTDVDGTKRTLDFSLRRLRFTYDDAGRKLSRALEREGDGVVQHLTRYEYDDHGTLLRAVAHWDERYDSVTTYEHDDRGAVITEISDGGAEGIKRFEYDADDHPIRETEDFGADGSIERTVTRSFGAGEGGLLLREVIEEAGIGTRTIDYEYDEHGNVLTRHEVARESDESGVEVIDRHQYGCWSVEGAVAVDTRNGT